MKDAQSASADHDAITYAVGSAEFFDQVMEWYLDRELAELESPVDGAIALYFNTDDDLIHVGRVRSSEEGLVVVSSIEGRLSPFVTYTSEFPMSEIVRVTWIEATAQ